MPDLVEIIKSRLEPEVPQLAKCAELSPSETRTALDAVVPALIHGFGTSGATSAGATQLSQFAKEQQGVTSPTEPLASEEGITRLSAAGGSLLPAIFGDNLGRTTDCVATSTGIRYNSAAALMHLVAPLAMGVMGGEARRLNMGGTALTKFLGDQRGSTFDAMPRELAGCLGLQRPQAAVAAPMRPAEAGRAQAAVATPVRAVKTGRAQVTTPARAEEPLRATAPVVPRERRTIAEPARAKTPWWLWLIPLVALIGLGAWLLSLNRPEMPTVAPSEAPAVTAPTAPAIPTVAVPDAAAVPGAAAPPAGAVPTALPGTVWMWERLQRPNTTDVQPSDPRAYTLNFATPSEGGLGDIDYRADCNAGRGTYTQSGNSLDLDTTAVPRAGCGTGSMSDEFLSRLGDVNMYEIRDGRLYLNLKDNTGTLEFAPMPAQ
jgi:heat shock protein HslJ